MRKEPPQMRRLLRFRKSVSQNFAAGGETKWNLFFAPVTVAPTGSRALFAHANRGAASKPPRFIRHWRRVGDFHVRGKKYFSVCQCASAASACSTLQNSKNVKHFLKRLYSLPSAMNTRLDTASRMG